MMQPEDKTQEIAERAERLQEIGSSILRAARDELYLGMRFLDVALSSFSYQMDGQVYGFGTDGRVMYFQPQMLGGLYRENRILVNRGYLHMVFHCIFRHFAWSGTEGKKRADDGITIQERMRDLSCDIAVEHMIDGMNYRSIRFSRSLLRRETYRLLEKEGKTLNAQRVYKILSEWNLNEKDLTNLEQEFRTDDHRYWESKKPDQKPNPMLSRNIVVLAGVINALKVVGKKKEDCRVVVNGAGSAGVAITKLLLTYGFPNIIMCDKVGIVSKDTEGLNWMQKKMTEVTNLNNETGSLADALKGADIFIGVSAPNIVTPEMVASMNRDSILFAMANPVPEIMPDVAKAAGARVVGTGRSDFPNQVNNVVAFPGIFKGALEGRATQITEEMKLAAAEAIAGLVPADKLSDDNIMPEAFDPQVAEVVADAVKSHIH